MACDNSIFAMVAHRSAAPIYLVRKVRTTKSTVPPNGWFLQ